MTNHLFCLLKAVFLFFAGDAAIPERETGTEVGTETMSATESATECLSVTESATESVTESATETDTESVTEMTCTTGRVQQNLGDTENIPGRETETRSAHEKDTEITETDIANLVRSSLI